MKKKLRVSVSSGKESASAGTFKVLSLPNLEKFLHSTVRYISNNSVAREEVELPERTKIFFSFDSGNPNPENFPGYSFVSNDCRR